MTNEQFPVNGNINSIEQVERISLWVDDRILEIFGHVASSMDAISQGFALAIGDFGKKVSDRAKKQLAENARFITRVAKKLDQFALESNAINTIEAEKIIQASQGDATDIDDIGIDTVIPSLVNPVDDVINKDNSTKPGIPTVDPSQPQKPQEPEPPQKPEPPQDPGFPQNPGLPGGNPEPPLLNYCNNNVDPSGQFTAYVNGSNGFGGVSNLTITGGGTVGVNLGMADSMLNEFGSLLSSISQNAGNVNTGVFYRDFTTTACQNIDNKMYQKMAVMPIAANSKDKMSPFSYDYETWIQQRYGRYLNTVDSQAGSNWNDYSNSIVQTDVGIQSTPLASTVEVGIGDYV